MGNTTGSRKKKAIRGAWKLGMVLAGNTLYALGVTLFLLPLHRTFNIHSRKEIAL